MRARLSALTVLLTLLAACDQDHDIIVNLPTAPTPDVTVNTIEMRVVGNASAVRIRHVNPIDGLTQVQTVLPYLVSMRTDQVVMFLSMEVTPIGYPLDVVVPFISAQIFVNGVVFREGSAADFSLNTVAVSGTWRK